uniref:Membrane-anchored ubiquitin-fold protein n=1 Tax=Wollemia nobilis TaxID=56998 RepID=A0A0C9RNL9_9CONI
MADVELLELKFRLFDGTDIGPNKYASASTISTIKESIIAQWPQDKAITPKTIDDIKLINAGRILENKETLTESRIPVGDLPGGVITMLVVVRHQLSNKKSEKQLKDFPKNKCSCTIL